MKLRAILVDDEKHSLETTSILIRKFCTDVEIIAELNQPIEAVEVINREEPDLLFLDISMPQTASSVGLKPKIPISSLNGIELIEVEQIIRCESDGNYTTIVLPARKVTVSKTLKEIEKQLVDFPYFFRLHNSHLVNLNHVAKYIRGEGGSVILTNNEEIGVSRSKKFELLEVLGIN